MDDPRRDASETPEPPVDATAAEDDPGAVQEPLEVTAAPEDASDADEYRPPSTELVVSEDRDVFEVMDAHDVEQIIDAMQGRLLDVSLYSFEQGGQRVTELSWKGVRECVFEMNQTGKCRIGVIPETLAVETVIEDGETVYKATVFARDEVSGAAYAGFAKEPKMMKLRNGKEKLDPYAETKAINKSERNSLRKFIPERLAQTLIAQFLKDENRVKQLRSEGPMVGKVAELPPPIDTDEARVLVAEVDRLWEEVRAVPGFAAVMTPAVFFAYKTRAVAQKPGAPGDVTELVQFRDTLVDVLERARRKASDG